jgi:hypothetical protein
VLILPKQSGGQGQTRAADERSRTGLLLPAATGFWDAVGRIKRRGASDGSGCKEGEGGGCAQGSAAEWSAGAERADAAAADGAAIPFGYYDQTTSDNSAGAAARLAERE